jgi:hypothetical protein
MAAVAHWHFFLGLMATWGLSLHHKEYGRNPELLWHRVLSVSKDVLQKEQETSQVLYDRWQEL